MAAYYSRSTADQLPLTPPDSGSRYGYSNIHHAPDAYGPHQSVSQPRHDASYDHQPGYLQPAVAPAPPKCAYQPSRYQAGNALPPIQSYYEPTGAPILPPLRISDRVQYPTDYGRRLHQGQQEAAAREQQRQALKDEKATGGVSAKLDYDMDRMTDFVTEATQSMYAFYLSPVCMADIDVSRSFHHTVQSPTSSFRKWVHQVLSATRLPSGTILLSLHYLSQRLVHFPDSVQPGENQIYRLLAVALILGSKFLDDNTFINRSWSDVTAIKVSELNLLERTWLLLIHWDLHVDPANGLHTWADAWKDFDAECAARQPNTRLAPLDTKLHQQPAHPDRYSAYPSPYSATSTRAYETPHSARSSQYTSTPYSSADPWNSSDRPPFDDFYKRQHRFPTLTEIDDDVNRRASEERARQAAYAYPQPQPQPQPQHSYYQPAYSAAWDYGAHRYDCACSSCLYHHWRPYPTHYSAQTVMG